MMDIYLGSGAFTPEEFGKSWIGVPELTGKTLRLSKNAKSYKSTCALTGIGIYIIRNSEEGKTIEEYLKDGEFSVLGGYISRLVLNNSTITGLHRAIRNRLQKEYERGRTEIQEELKELLGL